MTEKEALDILKEAGYNIKNGFIYLKKTETKREGKAIDYLCGVWDYSTIESKR